MPTERAATFNEGLMEVSRTVNPVLYTVAGDYEHDPALQVPMLPALQSAKKLAKLDPASGDYRFLRTQLVRERNRTEDALYQATRRIETLLRNLV